ncbi:unnamed protein product, partial [Brachionus calyciflorus]
YQYWFKELNKKSNTSRYVCCHKFKSKCFTSITISNVDQSIKRLNDNHGCNSFVNDAKIATSIAKQELKTNVHTNKSKPLREYYNDVQRNLLTQNVPERAIAPYFPSFQKISSTLSKIRSSNKPSIPDDFSSFEITGEYTRTTQQKEFLRYDNKSKTNRIIIFIILNPIRIMADFEKASTNAMIFYFPSVIIKGCWFHFRQAIFKNSVRIGPSGQNDIIREAMPDDPKCAELLKYFERQWLKNIKPNVWNRFDSVVRTNNRIEGFHSAINKHIKSKFFRPNFFYLGSSNYILYKLFANKTRITISKQSKNDAGKDLIYGLLKFEFSSSSEFKEYFYGISYHIKYLYEKIFNFDAQEEFIQSNDHAENQTHILPEIIYNENRPESQTHILPEISLNENRSPIETINSEKIVNDRPNRLHILL